MATAPTELQFGGLLKCLVEKGVLEENDAKAHADEAQKKQCPIVSHLVLNNIADSKKIASLASLAFAVPFFDLDSIEVKNLPVDLVSEKLIRQHHVLPLFKRGNRLFIAVSDPTNFQALDEIKFHTRLNTETILVEENKLTQSIEIALEAAASSMDDLLDEDLGNIDISVADETPADDDSSDIDDAPIVRLVNKILLDSIKKGVSDIHLEPYEKKFRIRFRSDGILYQVASPPTNIANRLISRIKVMSKMNIAERRVPQDGRIKMKLSKNKAIDFRVSTCPTLFGEKVVLRILDPSSAEIDIEKLGFEPKQQELFLAAIDRPYGMVLVTGPTGSGKTVSLYTGLNILNKVERNISTAEDPVEITVEGINQVNMNVKAGLTFAKALKAFLRQDPDIIMVGEIRDLETASIAVKAAQTGHLVLSTLHTNDAPQTINRLMQMGIEPFNIVSVVNLIMAQRLARRLCKYCKKEADYPEKTFLDAGFKKDQLGSLKTYVAVGCEHCNAGYKGRIGVYQVMPISEKMRALILSGGNAMEMSELSKSEGVNDLRASGLDKVRQGITSLEEINRITEQ
ncbi:MAG: type IV-A pilus assembly ATPase PilB [Methylococcales symbiont of Iophon sp. n. MRB-2018]|nr:MAG: type IV-A pilus assembly ATPase PilB [Methylococcales symbiont of Iophon sp. n. MRB-2018]KAF3979957.1 MAG: type IV-A pilus assembly ATPase PilB [Methylococcales symbiont of Iophon sp. n. MRB-2018]